MKLKKSLALVLLVAFCTVFLTGCRCEPSEYKWEIVEVTRDVTFLNGKTEKMAMGRYVNGTNPVGIHNGMVNIDFSPDGTVVFEPVDGEVLHGTYTYKHNGFADTSFAIAFENGETITDGNAWDGWGQPSITFTFRGASYWFGAWRDGYDEESYLQDIQYNIQYLRNHDKTASIYDATIELTENGTKAIFENGELDLYADVLGLQAVHITGNDEYIVLDELRAGECLLVLSQMWSETLEEYADSAVVYYIDPYPTPPTVEDLSLDMAKKLPWLTEAIANYKNTEIRITASATKLPVGFTEYHQYIRDPAAVLAYLETLNGWKLFPESDPTYGELMENNCSQYLISVTVGAQTYGFRVIQDYLIVGEELYSFMDGSTVKRFPGIDYNEAVMTFKTVDETKVYDGKEYLYTLTGFWQDLEFVIDKETHSWTTAQETRTLVCDFGEVTVYDAVHFRYKGQNYVVAGNKDFSALFA